MDRGESAKTANRPGLQAMLARLTEGDIDYVIVHKIDRLARNRADDVSIVMSIRQAGARLVSASENIDETPSGLLLHGIMSSIAEFYSRNLATEIIKGSTQKAKKGGTPYRAPIGYLNTREMVDGREIRTISIDPDRAPLVREAFTLYASGDYALSELASILEAHGLRSRPSRKLPAKALGANRLSAMLRNTYYIGAVQYAGKSYPGRHEPLIDEDVFERVQAVLDGQRQSGERAWRHHHYLRGSIFCGECGGRLFYTRSRGRRGGIYEYFTCRGRQHGGCSQGHHRTEAVEDAIVRHYSTVKLTAKRRAQIQQAVRDYLDHIEEIGRAQTDTARNALGRLDTEERKLLSAHYNDDISESLFKEEQVRIRRERSAAEKLIEQFNIRHDEIREALDVALEITEDIQTGYLARHAHAAPHVQSGHLRAA